MHILDPLIQRIHALKLADFTEHEEDDEYQAHDGHVPPHLIPVPPMFFVSIFHQFHFRSYYNFFIFHLPSHRMVATQEDVKDRRAVDAMNINWYLSNVEEVPDSEDDESEKAPNERNTDTESNGETP